MSRFITTETATGRIVQEGDTITDFRGESAIFRQATRAAEPGKSGKVMAGGRELYDKVFGLEVTPNPHYFADTLNGLAEGATATLVAPDVGGHLRVTRDPLGWAITLHPLNPRRVLAGKAPTVRVEMALATEGGAWVVWHVGPKTTSELPALSAAGDRPNLDAAVRLAVEALGAR